MRAEADMIVRLVEGPGARRQQQDQTAAFRGLRGARRQHGGAAPVAQRRDVGSKVVDGAPGPGTLARSRPGPFRARVVLGRIGSGVSRLIDKRLPKTSTGRAPTVVVARFFTLKHQRTMSDSEAEGGVPLLDPEFDVTADSKKRKRGDNDADAGLDKKALKKAKRKEKKKAKAKDIDENDLDQELGVNRAFQHMDSQLLADYINARTRLYGKDLSSVELEDRFVPGISARCSAE